MKMHIDEVHIDVHLVKRLLTSQFPQWANLPIEPVSSSGTSNALYRLGKDMVVRLPRIRSAAKPVDKEHEWLPKLTSLLPFAIPEPFGKGKPAEGYPYQWSIYRWIEGETPVVDQLKDPESLAMDLAKFIVLFHKIALKDGPPARRGAHLSVQDPQMRTALKESQKLVDVDAVRAIWEKALKVPEYTGSPVWVHGDLLSMNLLLVNDRLSAVIDFGGIGIGDPACDMIPAWNLFPAKVRGTFREILQADDATWERGRGWALSIALIQLPYYKDTNPELAANARHTINEVLADKK